MQQWGIMLAAAVLIASVAGARCAVAEEAQRGTPTAPGMRVYIDPETGDFGAAPEGAAESAPLLERAGPDEALVEEQNPAGGYTVHLQRRFGGVVRATAGADGAEVECETDDLDDRSGER